MKQNINKNISVWRGNDTPPTDYHIWIKDDGSLNIKILDKWVNKDQLYDYKTSDLTNQDLLINDTDTVYQAIGKLEKAIIDNEQITANSILHIVNKIEQVKEEVVTKDDQVFEKGTGNQSIQSIDSNCKATGDYSVAAGFHAYASGRGSMALCRGGEAMGSNSVCLGGVIYGIKFTGKGNDTEYTLDKLHAESQELLVGCKILRTSDLTHIATIISTKTEGSILKVYTDNTLSDTDITNKQFGVLISKAMGNQSLTYGGGTTIGQYGFSGGFATIATGKQSISLGEKTNSVGDNSVCVGFGISSSGKFSSAIGADSIYVIYLSSYDSLGNQLNENEYRISKGSNFRTLRNLKNLVGSYININTGLYPNKTVYPKVLSYEIKQDGYYIKLSYSLGIAQDEQYIVFFQEASGLGSISENCSKSKGDLSHSGGFFTSVEGDASFGFGYINNIKGDSSVGIGEFLETSNNNETAFGVNNITHKGNDISQQTLFSVGNGEVKKVDHTNYVPVEDNGERNAIEIMKNGDVYIPGNIYNNSYGKDKKPLHSLPDQVSNIANAQLKLSEELDGKAPKVGYAPDLKVDFAKELVGRVVAEPQEIGTIRPTGLISIGDGNATIERVKGKSVVWNQLVPRLADWSSNGVSYVAHEDGTVTLSGVATDNVNYKILDIDTSLAGHKFALVGGFSSGNTLSTYLLGVNVGDSFNFIASPAVIFSLETQKSVKIFLRVASGMDATGLSAKPKLYNLTQMFGAGNEPTTIEEFEARKPLGVTDDYNEGEIISYDGANELKSVGFNLWNGKNYFSSQEYGKKYSLPINDASVVEQIRRMYYLLKQGYDIYYSCKVTGTVQGVNIGSIGLFVDGKLLKVITSNYINKATNFSNVSEKDIAKADTARIYTTSLSDWSISDICIHLAHTGYRNGEYKPYEEDTLQLPNIKAIKDKDGNPLFPYGLLSAGSAHDEITATKAIKRVGKRAFADGDKENASVLTDGTSTLYALEEPIEVDLAEPLNLTYDAWDFGTEELHTEAKTTPLNADIVYQFNAVDRIRENTTQITSLSETKADKSYADTKASQATQEVKEYTDEKVSAVANGQLKLSVKDNGNVVLSNANGESKEFMPATPSGDPMHYAYVAAGAEYNDTGADITRIGVFGDAITWKAGYWWFNELGDISNEEIKYIYLYRYTAPSSVQVRSYFQAFRKTRTPMIEIPARAAAIDASYFAYSTIFETIALTQTQDSVLVGNMDSFMSQSQGVKKIINGLDLTYLKSESLIKEAFNNASRLEEVRLYNLQVSVGFEKSKNLSNASILCMIENEIAGNTITITLHADAYVRAMADANIVEALAAHTNVTLASA